MHSQIGRLSARTEDPLPVSRQAAQSVSSNPSGPRSQESRPAGESIVIIPSSTSPTSTTSNANRTRSDVLFPMLAHSARPPRKRSRTALAAPVTIPSSRSPTPAGSHVFSPPDPTPQSRSLEIETQQSSSTTLPPRNAFIDSFEGRGVEPPRTAVGFIAEPDVAVANPAPAPPPPPPAPTTLLVPVVVSVSRRGKGKFTPAQDAEIIRIATTSIGGRKGAKNGIWKTATLSNLLLIGEDPQRLVWRWRILKKYLKPADAPAAPNAAQPPVPKAEGEQDDQVVDEDRDNSEVEEEEESNVSQGQPFWTRVNPPS